MTTSTATQNSATAALDPNDQSGEFLLDGQFCLPGGVAATAHELDLPLGVLGTASFNTASAGIAELAETEGADPFEAAAFGRWSAGSQMASDISRDEAPEVIVAPRRIAAMG